ncbi:MAG: LysR family transcriptional regulator [Sediminimonas qiaohouensis]|uniref:LysR family transcriptional regulator n=1 Tax=Sediminimonas qiaohouensis TaxID=552061 RepID=A0A7C9LQZ9_9RHOB|nr:LysR family transcriptional regulator [Sediminimonas qiaohouensis]MTJ03836.1 LysR family transcriptional regulator [Sediminimonas qiaohouensis]
MIAPRRFLPSIRSLLALEAVDRLGTATAAADELSLTHSAVSRQLKVLEEQLAVSLLIRQGKRLQLTPAGAAYAQSVRTILNDLARESLNLKATGSRDRLNLAILPAFGMHWLNPRLRSFCDAYPDITVNQTTRVAPFDFERENFDAALHFGARDWAGMEYLPLANERVLAVCAPDFADDLPMPPQRLLEMPLLHLDSRPGAWEQWFQKHGCDAPHLRGMLFDQFANMVEAAAAGFGAALLPDFLASKELKAGRLATASSGYMDAGGTYYLIWPKSRTPSESLSQLIDWLSRSADVPAGAVAEPQAGQSG